MNTPSLSVIIITLNEEARLPNLLGDLASQTWAEFEVIHVDSNSSDRTLEVSHRMSGGFRDYRIVSMQKRGVSLGRNTGAAVASADRLLFLDADTRLDPEFLEQAIEELETRDLEVGIACMSAVGLPLRHRIGYCIFNAGIRLTSLFFPTAIGACLFSEREIHEEIGGFDEEISLCEDCNYVLKASRAPLAQIGVITPRFRFDPRRLDQDGALRTGFTYLRANLHRFFRGELRRGQIPYEFGHYRQASK
jgi:hypothetical protein